MVKKRPSAGLSDAERSALVARAKRGKSLVKSGDSFDELVKKFMAQGMSREKAVRLSASLMWRKMAKYKREGKLQSKTGG